MANSIYLVPIRPFHSAKNSDHTNLRAALYDGKKRRGYASASERIQPVTDAPLARPSQTESV